MVCVNVNNSGLARSEEWLSVWMVGVWVVECERTSDSEGGCESGRGWYTERQRERDREREHDSMKI